MAKNTSPPSLFDPLNSSTLYSNSVLSICVMMSQQSGDPFAALIRVNTVIQAVVSNSNRDIRGETRAEYQGRQEGKNAGRYQSKTRETVQSQNNDQTEKDDNAQKCLPGQYKTS